MSFENLAREISRQWKEASEETKSHYQDLADQDRERYVHSFIVPLTVEQEQF